MARATLAAASLSDNALVAQWIERRFPEPQVVGSTPIEGTEVIAMLSATAMFVNG